jgi:hypothetical protein
MVSCVRQQVPLSKEVERGSTIFWSRSQHMGGAYLRTVHTPPNPCFFFWALIFPFAARQIPREFRCGISRSTRAVSSENDASRTVANHVENPHAISSQAAGRSGAVGAPSEVGGHACDVAGQGSHTEGHRVAPGSGSAWPVRATNQSEGLPDPHLTRGRGRGAHVMASAADLGMAGRARRSVAAALAGEPDRQKGMEPTCQRERGERLRSSEPSRILSR